jgi:hypothetical protein
MNFIIAILIALTIAIIALFFFPFSIPVAMGLIAVFISIAIPLALILAFMTEVLHMSPDGYNIPGVPSPPPISCFDKNTLIEMTDGSFKKIMDIRPGDILENDIIVTCVLKLDSHLSSQKMYELNGILVSGNHPVFYDLIKKWIPVYQHPNSIIKYDYFEHYLYCLTTNTKEIKIKDTLFLDWDEVTNKIDKIDIIDLHNLHKKSKGLEKNTKIKLTAKVKKIKDIEIGDIIEKENRVIGMVEIKNNLGDDTLFQLITEKKYFYIYDEVDEIKIKHNDYDYNIEAYLDLIVE